MELAAAAESPLYRKSACATPVELGANSRMTTPNWHAARRLAEIGELLYGRFETRLAFVNDLWRCAFEGFFRGDAV